VQLRLLAIDAVQYLEPMVQSMKVSTAKRAFGEFLIIMLCVLAAVVPQETLIPWLLTDY
jgi:hypothetical protein